MLPAIKQPIFLKGGDQNVIHYLRKLFKVNKNEGIPVQHVSFLFMTPELNAKLLNA